MATNPYSFYEPGKPLPSGSLPMPNPTIGTTALGSQLPSVFAPDYGYQAQVSAAMQPQQQQQQQQQQQAARSTDPVATQQVRQQELADAFQQQLKNVGTFGQGAMDQAAALSPKLTQTAEDAYQSALANQDLGRYREAIGTAAEQRGSAVQQTLANLKNQAQLGYDTARRSLDSQRAAMGLPTESTDFYRSMGESYYRNFLPVEAQALAMQQQNIEQNLAAEQALKNLELQTAAQRMAASGQYASALERPIGIQFDALRNLGAAYTGTIPLAEAGYYNYLQGDDQLPAVAFAPPSYNLPPLYDPIYDIRSSYGYQPSADPGTSYAAFAQRASERLAADAAANAAANAAAMRQRPIVDPATGQQVGTIPEGAPQVSFMDLYGAAPYIG